MKRLLLLVALLASGCVSKKVCMNGGEPYHSVLDPENSCKPRIRKVIIGSDIDVPKSIAIGKKGVDWTYDWRESSFRDGEVEMGHLVLRPDVGGN